MNTEENIDGTGWTIIRPRPGWTGPLGSFDELVPDAPWFWGGLQRHCVAECCGLAAYDFAPEHVAWVCHLTDDPPPGLPPWRQETPPGSLVELEGLLRSASDRIELLEFEGVSAAMFNEILTPASYASLFEELADVLAEWRQEHQPS